MALRQWMRRLCFGGALALGAAALLAPLSEAADEPLPEVFRGYAYATGVHFELNTDPAQTIPELVRMDVPHGESSIGSGDVARGRASFAYPGSSGDLATFLCLLGFPCDQIPPPNWPFTARAEHPFQPHGEAQAQGPGIDQGHFQLAAGHSVADAAVDRVTTRATIGSFLFGNMGTGPLTPETALLSVGSSVATTSHEVVDGVLVTTAEAVLTDVGIAGRTLEIGTIVARSQSRSDGADTTTAAPDITVSGVTLAGQEAAITEDGLVVAGEPQDSGALGAVTGGFSQLLSNGTIDVTLVGADEAVEGHTADGMVAGIQVTYRLDGRGFPAGSALVGGFLLGNATSSAQVLPAGSDVIDLGDIGTGDFTGPTGGDGGAVLGGGFSNPGPAGGLGDFPTPGDSPGAPSSFNESPRTGGDGNGFGSPEARPGPLERLSDNVADRIGLLYLAVALAAVGLALGVRAPGLRL